MTQLQLYKQNPRVLSHRWIFSFSDITTAISRCSCAHLALAWLRTALLRARQRARMPPPPGPGGRPTQQLLHANTVWGVAALDNGNVVTACADGVVRVSSHAYPERFFSLAPSYARAVGRPADDPAAHWIVKEVAKGSGCYLFAPEASPEASPGLSSNRTS